MKNISKIVACLVLVSVVFAAVTVVPRAAEPKIVSAQPIDEPDRLNDMLTVVAKRVSEIPTIDGDFSDPAWAEAKATTVAATVWKAVYTDDELAMYIRWVDPDASIDSRGSWNFDPDTQSWWRTGWEEGTWESTRGRRHPEWFNIAFDISSDVSDTPVGEVGCGAFCHEYPPGSGVFHHQTSEVGAYVDTWGILTKHGFGSLRLHDLGWIQGVTSVSQGGELVFNSSDPIDSRGVIDGNLTFVGYAEDKLMAAPDDPAAYADRDTPANLYCRNCHDQVGVPFDPLKINFTHGDPGDIMYSENWDVAQAAPVYIETSPENFIDCMTLTQAEVDAGEAVLVADLSEAELAEAWSKYVALNGTVPQLVLQEPSGEQADVRVAANWHNGYWTVELKRKLVTGDAYDVQFDELTKDYYFGVSLFNHGDILAGMNNAAWTLRFEQ